MKVLIGYDDSESSKTIINELKTAGLPDGSEIFVVLANEILAAPPNLQMMGAPSELGVTSAAAEIEAESKYRLEKTKKALEFASTTIQAEYPAFTVTAYTVVGNPAEVLISQAKEKDIDLIIVGSHNRSALGRLFLGSVSKEVVENAHCSVRVARSKKIDDKISPQKLVIGLDVTQSGGEIALQQVLSRNWAEGSTAQIVTATDGTSVDAAQAITRTIMAREAQNIAKEKLAERGLAVFSVIKEGSTPEILMDEAEKLGADCIFVGTRNLHGFLNKYFQGSVSDELVKNASCSVEVVR